MKSAEFRSEWGHAKSFFSSSCNPNELTTHVSLAEEIDWIFNWDLRDVVLDLDLDRVIWHTFVHHSSTSTHIPNLSECEKHFVDGRTWILRLSRPKNENKSGRAKVRSKSYPQSNEGSPERKDDVLFLWRRCVWQAVVADDILNVQNVLLVVSQAMKILSKRRLVKKAGFFSM